MSEFHVDVVKIGNVVKHENADTLSITLVHGGYPVIFKSGEFKEGDLAVYVPVDSIVPDTERWSFLGGHRRIRAKRLRGVFSMGLLTHPEPTWSEGLDVREELLIEKYEPVIHLKAMFSFDDRLPEQSFMPKYTDIEGFRRWDDIFKEGEDVVITEKIHGMNFRSVYHNEQLWVGSHNITLKDGDSIWWKIATEIGLEEILSKAEDCVIYGELYGNVQDLTYDSTLALRVFDILDVSSMRYVNHNDLQLLCTNLGLDIVPVIYRGPWDKSLMSLAEGNTTLNAKHVREGIVIKPAVERFDHRIGRTILKLVGEGYLLRKEK